MASCPTDPWYTLVAVKKQKEGLALYAWATEAHPKEMGPELTGPGSLGASDRQGDWGEGFDPTASAVGPSPCYHKSYKWGRTFLETSPEGTIRGREFTLLHAKENAPPCAGGPHSSGKKKKKKKASGCSTPQVDF
ncbi:hypothetical protein Pcinc_030181 [Petrolisthes cinctipes]|uniref:Uncharacterized protein n=1 Tax=Petrolisthes cinctipes TaxID=88211 RepID=A0AAE1K6C5_PETCI|nr:hypothetical protein Pcinc_030181 [Petrolisthes cinctipes]